ncbi:MAG: hypothetical protein IPL53_06855 [Ignavibacteria bacterium]|nr:hypothetical protein [Ignavibacteria bacterium]
MKNTISCFAVCSLILFAGCNKNVPQQEITINKSVLSGQDEIDREKDNPLKSSSSLKTITSKEVKLHIGDSLIIKGYVADIYLSDKVAYLNFENKFPKNVFTCTVFSGKMNEFGDLSSFKGKNVEVTGKISTYKNKPQVILNSKDQIKIIQ